MLAATDLEEKFGQIKEYWRPYIIGELNGQQVKLAKGLGSLPMHRHAQEAELFLVHKGVLRLVFDGGNYVDIKQGQLYIVPAGVDHQPVAEHEVELILFEPATTAHTGNIEVEQTQHTLTWL